MSMNMMVAAMKLKVGNPLRKLVLIKLADNANDNGECWPAYSFIAKHCEISKSTVKSHIRQLEAMGLIKREFRKNGPLNQSNIFHLTLDAEINWGGATADLGQEKTEGEASDNPGGGATAAPRISHSFESVIEPSVDDVKKKKSSPSFCKESVKNTWNEVASTHGLPGIRGVTKSVESGLKRLYASYLEICRQDGDEPVDMDTLINRYLSKGYQPTEWAKGNNPEGKKYGIETALTQKVIDRVLGEANG